MQRQLQPGELVFACLGDFYVVTTPDRVLAVYNLLQRNCGDTQESGCTTARHKCGTSLECGLVGATRLIERHEPPILSSQRCGASQHCPQNFKAPRFCIVLWAMMIFVHVHLERTHQAHRTLLQRIFGVPDVQSAWALLLNCVSVRANHSCEW